MQKSITIQGQLAFNRATVMLFVCGIGVVFSFIALVSVWINVHVESIQQPILLFLFLLLVFSLFYYLRASENYTFKFTEDALIIKSLFLNNPQTYTYNEITKISISGNLVQPKLNGIKVNLTYTKNGRLCKTDYAIHNLNSADFKQVINHFRKANIIYHYHPA